MTDKPQPKPIWDHLTQEQRKPILDEALAAADLARGKLAPDNPKAEPLMQAAIRKVLEDRGLHDVADTTVNNDDPRANGIDAWLNIGLAAELLKYEKLSATDKILKKKEMYLWPDIDPNDLSGNPFVPPPPPPTPKKPASAGSAPGLPQSPPGKSR